MPPGNELLELGQAGIHVAEYLTDLPLREVLRQKLHEAIALSRRRLENLGATDDCGIFTGVHQGNSEP